MWIETPETLVRIKDPGSGEYVDTSGDGATQVSQDVGESLIKHFDAITEHDS